MSVPREPSDAGQVIGGRYVLQECLGRGGMAAVYRARDARTGQMLALKRSIAPDRSAALRRRASLEREYQTLTQLTHPSIIEVHDYGVDVSGPYYTMELLDGRDLDASGALPWRDVARLLRDLASSLAILHSRGLLHRDISASNVRRTADGRAKLIDFGAMTSIGVVSDVVGTPPFMAPEALQMQALDARADLFSLGALGYYALTGRHAYPARKLHELRDVWRSRPPAPRRLIPDVPSALNDLVLELLSLERGARPDSAADVIGRLCTIADLPVEELGAVSRSYLHAPTLVGRDAALVAVRGQMLSLVRGDGGALVALGPRGSGRSRLLDACALEGKLLGAHVLRVDAAAGNGGAWSVAHDIGLQLITLFPEAVAEAARHSLDLLGSVLPELRSALGDSVVAELPQRSQLLRELRNFFLQVTRDQRVVLAIDDLERIDEPSCALLAALVDKLSRHGMLIALSLDRDAEAKLSSSHRLLRSLATPIELQALDADQTEAMLRSVFGDVPRLPLCAARIHELAQGNPRTIMELAQHLVDRGLARYTAGSWLISAELVHADLPRTLADSLRRRCDALSRDARELAEALSLIEDFAIGSDRYPELTSHGDVKRVLHALQELVTTRVLIATGDSYRFSQLGFVSVLRDSLSAERSHQLHGRLADQLEASGSELLLRAHHLLRAGRGVQAVQLLCALSLLDLLSLGPSIELLERALAAAEAATDLPRRQLLQLRMALVMRGPVLGDSASFRRQLPATLSQLEYDSGLQAFHELSHLPPEQRLSEALRLQHERYQATPESQRVYGVATAIRELAQLMAAAASMAVVNSDLELLESLPSLEPLLPLSPALVAVAQVIEACRAWISGQIERSARLYQNVLDRVAMPDRAGIEHMVADGIQYSVEYALAITEAVLGIDRAEQRAQSLERYRVMRAAAFRVRMLLHLTQGRMEAARKCQRKSELLLLQDSGRAYYTGTTAAHELLSYAMLGDVIGVRACVEVLAERAEHSAGWRALYESGRARLCEMQGDLQGALRFTLEGLTLAAPGRHPSFGLLAAAHVRVLYGLGRLHEALEHGERYLEICEHAELVPMNHYIGLELAPALAAVGQHARALMLLEQGTAWTESFGASGFALGRYYEVRAKLALGMHDEAKFAEYVERCALEFQKAGNPTLNARVLRLLEQAELRRLHTGPALRELGSVAPAPSQLEYLTLHARLLECKDKFDRARCALTLLLQSTEGHLGYLYGVDGNNITPLAGLPEPPCDAELESWLENWLNLGRPLPTQLEPQRSVTVLLRSARKRDSETDADVTHSASTHEAVSSESSDRFVAADRRSFVPLLLIAERPGQSPRVAAMLVLDVSQRLRRRPSPQLLREIAEQLLEREDVSGADL